MSDYTTHPEYLALLKSVLANPDDDLPRLVLADWLEEHGEPERAEFVRVQCELARILESDDCRERVDARCSTGPNLDAGCECRGCVLRRREMELFKLSGPAGWWWDLPGQWRSTGDDMRIETADGFGYAVRRGFVTKVRCRLADLVGGEPCHFDFYVSGPCPRCGNTGRTVGVLPRLVREHPVERVVVTDAGIYPARFSSSNDGWIECPERDASSWMVPLVVWQEVVPRQSDDFWKNTFPTPDAAHAALSDALLRWAKAQPVTHEVQA